MISAFFFQFIVLSIYYLIIFLFSLYALHRLFIIFLYKKHYKKSSFKIIELKKDDPNLPFVTVQIPIYNEFYVAKRIIRAVNKLSYPKNKLEIQILDDSTDETSEIIKKEIQNNKKTDHKIFYYHRIRRLDFKAGALREGLKHAKGEVIAIFDADFLPDKNFLLKTVGYFNEPKVSIVQTRWTYLNSQSSIVTKSQQIILDAHFQIEHTARAFSRRFLNFNGTAGLLRTSAILEVGNWQGDTLTEDLDLSYRMQLKGYRIVYLPFVECLSELPENIASLKAQQSRWSQGSIQVAKKLLLPIMRSSFSLKIKLEVLMHLCAPLAYIGSFLLTIVMPIIAFTIRDVNKQYLKSLDITLAVLMLISLSTYYLYAQKELKNLEKKSFRSLPFMFSMGMVFCVSSSWAILKGFFGKKINFVRTPKYNFTNFKKNIVKSDAKKYQTKVNLFLECIEILFAILLNVSFYFIIVDGDWLRLPLFAILIYGFNCNLYLNFYYR